MKFARFFLVMLLLLCLVACRRKTEPPSPPSWDVEDIELLQPYLSPTPSVLSVPEPPEMAIKTTPDTPTAPPGYYDSISPAPIEPKPAPVPDYNRPVRRIGESKDLPSTSDSPQEPGVASLDRALSSSLDMSAFVEGYARFWEDRRARWKERSDRLKNLETRPVAYLVACREAMAAIHAEFDFERESNALRKRIEDGQEIMAPLLKLGRLGEDARVTSLELDKLLDWMAVKYQRLALLHWWLERTLPTLEQLESLEPTALETEREVTRILHFRVRRCLEEYSSE